MATIVLISLYDRNAFGQRLMSANLKKHGHQCHIIFLKRYETHSTYNLEYEEDEYPWLGINISGRVIKYAANSEITEIELELLREALSKIKPDIIGMTVNTPLRKPNSVVTRFIKQHFNVPIIWGGFDPTVNPARCLEYSEFVCIGEGDQTIIEIAGRIDQKQSIIDVCNLAYLRDSQIIYNPIAPLEKNINNYPWRDNSPENKYFIEDNQLTENYSIVNDRDTGSYQTMSARGCPYKCAYCCEASFKKLYNGEKFLRRRTPQDLIAELVQTKQQINLNNIHFDDEIFGMDLNWLKEFAPLYKEHINLPFNAYIYPSNNIEEILITLKDVGLELCCLALESGSERINKNVFGRVYDRELYLKAVRICKELSIQFYTDVITYNPYEQEEDLKDTLEVLLDMEGSFRICVNKLFILPGTKLAEQIQNDGLDTKDTSRDDLFNYYARLYWIATSEHYSRIVVRLIEMIPLFKKYPKLINPLIIKAILSPSVVYRRIRKLLF